MSLFDRLPNNILREILLLATTSGNGDALVMLQVSRVFRQTVLTIPRLWSKIIITDDPERLSVESDEHICTSLSSLNVVLSLTGPNTPLDLTIAFFKRSKSKKAPGKNDIKGTFKTGGRGGANPATNRNAAIALLLEQGRFARWSSLTVAGCQNLEPESFKVEGDATALKNIIFDLQETDKVDNWEYETDPFPGLFSLIIPRAVNLTDLSIVVSPHRMIEEDRIADSLVSAPFLATLENFSSMGLLPETIFPALNSMKNLKSLNLCGIEYTTLNLPDSVKPSTIRLHSTSLVSQSNESKTLVSAENLYFEVFKFDAIDYPGKHTLDIPTTKNLEVELTRWKHLASFKGTANLDFLKVKVDSQYEEKDVELFSVFDDSQHQIRPRVLHLQTPLEAEALIKLLKTLPALEEFRLHIGYLLKPSFWEALASDKDLIPNVRHLVFSTIKERSPYDTLTSSVTLDIAKKTAAGRETLGLPFTNFILVWANDVVEEIVGSHQNLPHYESLFETSPLKESLPDVDFDDPYPYTLEEEDDE